MRIPRLTPRSALLGLHIGALMFGLTGIFGKLILAGPLVIVFGRALFGALALGGAFRTPGGASASQLATGAAGRQRALALRPLADLLPRGEGRQRRRGDPRLRQFPGLHRVARRGSSANASAPANTAWWGWSASAW
jgi:hypothetical protein